MCFISNTLTLSSKKTGKNNKLFLDYSARNRKSAHTRHGEANGESEYNQTVCAVKVPVKAGMSVGPIWHNADPIYSPLMEIREKSSGIWLG